VAGHVGRAHGMEDARFVLFTESDGTTTYLATYTAFDGVHISSSSYEPMTSSPSTLHPSSGGGAE